MGEAIHNEKWPVVEKQQLWVIALHYSPCPVVWPALCGLPALLLTPPTSTTVRSKEEGGGVKSRSRLSPCVAIFAYWVEKMSPCMFWKGTGSELWLLQLAKHLLFDVVHFRDGPNLRRLTRCCLNSEENSKTPQQAMIKV